MIFGFFAILGGSTTEAETVGWFLALAVLFYLNYPGVRDQFIQHEMSLMTPEQRAAFDQMQAAQVAMAQASATAAAAPPPAGTPPPPAGPGGAFDLVSNRRSIAGVPEWPTLADDIDGSAAGTANIKGEYMTEERSLDELGPVDYLIVEFPAGQQNFTGEGVDELLRLHDAGTIRVMDILILQKGEDGTVMAQELGDLDDLGTRSGSRRSSSRRWPRRTSRTSPPRWTRAASPRSSSTRTCGRHPSPRPCAGRAASSSPTAGSPSRPSSPPSKPTRPLEAQGV